MVCTFDTKTGSKFISSCRLPPACCEGTGSWVPAADRPTPRRSNLPNPCRSTLLPSPLHYIKDEYRKQKTKLKEGKEELLLILTSSTVGSITNVADPSVNTESHIRRSDRRNGSRKSLESWERKAAEDLDTRIESCSGSYLAFLWPLKKKKKLSNSLNRQQIYYLIFSCL